MKKAMIWAAVAAGMMGAAAAATSTADYVQDGLVGHWDGIDNAGTSTHDPNATKWKDLTGITGDGTLAAGTKWNGGNCWTNGVDGKPVVVGTNFAKVMNALNFTVEIVVRPTRTGTRETLLGSYSAGKWNLEHNGGSTTGGGVRAYFNGTPDLAANNAPLAAGEGAVFTVCATPFGVRVYKNGDIANGFAGTPNAPVAGVEYVFGGEHDRGNMAFRGGCYAVRLYDRALTAAEVKANATVDIERFALEDDKFRTVTLPANGWTTMNGIFYAYTYPLYIADVATGSSSIDAMTFKKVETDGASVTTDVNYAEFSAATLTGTILKRGAGTLTFDKDISSFTGPVHIEEGVGVGTCSNCFGKTVHGGGNANQRTYVHAGATLVMDAAGNKPAPPEANAVYYEGEGYPGMGGALVARNGNTASGTSRWQMGCQSRAVGPARVYVDTPDGAGAAVSYSGNTGQPESYFSCNGQDVLLHGRTVGTQFSLGAAFITGFRELVISNLTLNVNGNSGRVIPLDGNASTSGNASTLRFTGGARWLWGTYDNLGRHQLEQTATLHVDDLEYIQLVTPTWTTKDNDQYGVNPWGVTNGTTNNWYCGPVVLNDHIRLYNAYSPKRASSKHWQGCTFSAQVSGPKGFRPWANASGQSWGDGLRLNLLYPTNTFEGGIVMDGGSIGVWAERAVPSQEGAGLVSLTNGYVYFGRQGRAPSTAKWPVFEMPVTEFVGSGAVTNGTGAWQGLVKKGEGTLDYNSQLGGAYLDLQGGIVKFNTQYREAYAGDYAQYAPDGYAAALPAFTKLKGTEGVLDLDGTDGSYTVQDMEGTPSVTNGSLTVTGDWTLDVATLAAHTKANISGTLTFGPDATVSVTGDITSVPHAGGFLVAKAASVSGLPKSTCKGWALMESGGELRLCYVAGTTILFR